MIQRIQTVYMLLAIVLLVVCACLPIGSYIPDGMGGTKSIYNLCVIDNATGNRDSMVVWLCALLATPAVAQVINIFKYNNRKAQMHNCMISIFLLIAWYVLYAIQIFELCPEGYSYEIGYAAILPAISIILLWMARRGVKHDEKLIRSVDRIR